MLSAVNHQAVKRQNVPELYCHGSGHISHASKGDHFGHISPEYTECIEVDFFSISLQ